MALSNVFFVSTSKQLELKFFRDHRFENVKFYIYFANCMVWNSFVIHVIGQTSIMKIHI
jgi:hypothetical protein